MAIANGAIGVLDGVAGQSFGMACGLLAMASFAVASFAAHQQALAKQEASARAYLAAERERLMIERMDVDELADVYDRRRPD